MRAFIMSSRCSSSAACCSRHPASRRPVATGPATTAPRCSRQVSSRQAASIPTGVQSRQAHLYFVKSTPSFSFWTICVAPGERPMERARLRPSPGRARMRIRSSRDGAHLYFISARPVTPGGSTGLTRYLGHGSRGHGWTDPRPLPAPINTAGAEWFPTLASTRRSASDPIAPAARAGPICIARLVDGPRRRGGEPGRGRERRSP